MVRRSMAWMLSVGEVSDSPLAAIRIASGSPECTLRTDRSAGVCFMVDILADVFMAKSISWYVRRRDGFAAASLKYRVSVPAPRDTICFTTVGKAERKLLTRRSMAVVRTYVPLLMLTAQSTSAARLRTSIYDGHASWYIRTLVEQPSKVVL
jgi:hypothetical protein